MGEHEGRADPCICRVGLEVGGDGGEGGRDDGDVEGGDEYTCAEGGHYCEDLNVGEGEGGGMW